MNGPPDSVEAAPCLWAQGADKAPCGLDSREHANLVEIARNLFRCPSATIVLDGMAAAGADDDSFDTHVARTRGPLVVEDTLDDPRFREAMMVRAFPHVRFYVGTAIRLRCGQVAGTLAVMDYIPRERPRAGELAALQSLAELAADFVEKALLSAIAPGQAAHFDALAGRARTSVLSIGFDGRITAANRAAQVLLRAPLATLVGRRADDHVIGWRQLLNSDAGDVVVQKRTLVEVVTADLGIVPALASLSTWFVGADPVHRLLVDELP